jgi:metal-sulfur cluster biosynthetic enzyme
MKAGVRMAPRGVEITPLRARPSVARSSNLRPCRSVYDPEIPVNIYDLGLVYTIDISTKNEVRWP